MSGRHGEYRFGVLLYGPPAAGKDTVTAALAAIAPEFRQFERLKVGSGKSSGYRMGSPEQLASLEKAGDVVYENARYGNVYVVDRPGLDDAFAAGVPVVHLGQVAGVHTVASGYRADWVTVLLWCSRETTGERSRGRGDADTTARLEAWDATQDDLDRYPGIISWDLTISTEDHTPEEAAQLIDRLLMQRAGAAQA
ncbi:guanylate kinase [Streptacidiphilus anmyonensis]|uniref:guanylate kinase n=1 Tax=Streptacidiphilus anmyonensis TaxID=405782 RepID=UPI0005AA9F5B|nr:guanylate kinase [Streptacidiphilus anmyonensis]